MARDSRGRFVSANAAAAERALEVAVAEARALMRRGVWRGESGAQVEADHLWLAEFMLLHAGHTADLLLSERAS